MIGYKVYTRDGLKGPFKKSSILKAITTAQIPLQARLLDLETGRYLSAAELVGESVDGSQPRPFPKDKPGKAEATPPSLKLDEDSGSKE